VTALSKTLVVLNQMQGDGVIGEYAIGGADSVRFNEILERHHLMEKWRAFQEKFLTD